jgi:hypothetical protein
MYSSYYLFHAEVENSEQGAGATLDRFGDTQA